MQTALPVVSPVSGTITALLVEDGTTINPGTALVTIELGAGKILTTYEAVYWGVSCWWGKTDNGLSLLLVSVCQSVQLD